MKVSKKNLVARIQKRFGDELSQHLIKDAAKVLIDTMISDLISDSPVSVENFGTLSPYVYQGHDGLNIATGKKVFVEPFRTVRFHPHEGLRALLERQKFRGRIAPKKNVRAEEKKR